MSSGPAAKRRVCIIQGHPDATGRHLCHALGDAYAEGARSAGLEVSRVDIGAMDLAFLRNPAEFALAPDQPVKEAQEKITNASHLVVIFPLWLGTMPALVKCFFEHVCRNNFAMAVDPRGGFPKQNLAGRTARVIVTMGMPAIAYRFMFAAHGVRTLSRSILGMAGIRPVRETLVGGVGALAPEASAALVRQMRHLGARAA